MIGNLFVNVKANTGGLTRGLAKSEKSVKRFGASMQRVGSKMTRGLSLPLLALGGNAVRVFASFEESMSRVKALTGATGEEFNALEKQARKLGKTTIFTARDAATAMSEFALAGFETGEIMESMQGTLDLAAAAQLNVGQAAKITTAVMGGMGIEAKDLQGAVDIMAKAFITSQTDLAQLGEGLKKVGPLAKLGNISFGETVSVLQALADGGLRAEEGGTAFRNILLRLTGAAPEATAKLKAMGIQTKDAGGNLLEISNIIGQLERKLAGLGPGDKLAVIGNVFGKLGAGGAGILIETGQIELEKMNDALLNLGNVAGEIAAIQMDNLAGTTKRMTSAIEGLNIEVGKTASGPLGKLIEGLTKGVVWFGNLEESTQKMVLGFAGFLVVVGPGLFIIGKLGELLTLAGTAAAVAGAPFIAAAAAVTLLVVAMTDLNEVAKKSDALPGILKEKGISGFEEDIKNASIFTRAGAVDRVASVDPGTAFDAKFQAAQAETNQRRAAELGLSTNQLDIERGADNLSPRLLAAIEKQTEKIGELVDVTRELGGGL